MKRFSNWRAALILYTAMFLGLWLVSVHAEFTRLVSIPGGTPPQRLTVSLGNAGYTGPSAMDEMTICVPDANVNTMYLGSQSSVNASTGFALAPGSCITYTAAGRPIEASSFWIFVATTESCAVSLRPR